MIMWNLEVNGHKIIWRSTFGKKMTFYFDDITYCERKKGSIRVYVNGEKLFTIDSNIDKTEFMEDIKRMTNNRINMGAGTIYGAINILVEKNYIILYSEEKESRKKKEYIITNLGKEILKEEIIRLEELIRNGKELIK